MKVILNQTVPKVGKEGQVVNVADGFARNYLFPRKLAILADKQQLKVHQLRQDRLASKLADTRSSAEELKAKLDGRELRIEGKAGKESTKLFGAVTAQDLTDAIAAQLGVTIERKAVGLLEPIKRLGTYNIEIDLHRDVDASVKVVVFDPAAVEAAPEQPAERQVEAAPPLSLAEEEPEPVA